MNKLAALAVFGLSCIATAQAHALTFAGSADQSDISLVVDGTSNTLLSVNRPGVKAK